MADQGSTKDQETELGKAPAEADAADLISLDELDQVINEQDPGFKESVSSLAEANQASDLNIELIDLDQLLAEQEAKSFSSRMKRLVRKIRNFATGVKTSSLYFLKERLPSILKSLKGKAGQGKEQVSEGLRQFGFKPRRFKLLVLGFVVLCGGVGALLYIQLTRGLLPTQEPLFIQGLDQLATDRGQYHPQAPREPFYGSVRVAQNILSIEKMVVNVKPSASSSANPMAAMSLYLEGMSADAIVEIKDREPEFRDHFMRIIEEFDYDELVSAEGKIQLQERLLREANRHISNGRIRRVYFQNFVMKP